MITNRSQQKNPFDEVGKLLKILSHPVRLAILEELREREQCVCHLEAHLGLRQAAISQHLSRLRSAGFIEDRREGWNVYYRVCDPRIFDLLGKAALLSGYQPEPSPVREPVQCPCPQCNPNP